MNAQIVVAIVITVMLGAQQTRPTTQPASQPATQPEALPAGVTKLIEIIRAECEPLCAKFVALEVDIAAAEHGGIDPGLSQRAVKTGNGRSATYMFQTNAAKNRYLKNLKAEHKSLGDRIARLRKGQSSTESPVDARGPKVGQRGEFTVGENCFAKVVRVIDSVNLIIAPYTNPQTVFTGSSARIVPPRKGKAVWLSNYPTEEVVDDAEIYLEGQFVVVVGTKTYDTALSTNTVFLLELVDRSKYAKQIVEAVDEVMQRAASTP